MSLSFLRIRVYLYLRLARYSYRLSTSARSHKPLYQQLFTLSEPIPKQTVHVVPSDSDWSPRPLLRRYFPTITSCIRVTSFSCLALSAPPEPNLHSLVLRFTLGVRVIAPLHSYDRDNHGRIGHQNRSTKRLRSSLPSVSRPREHDLRRQTAQQSAVSGRGRSDKIYA